MNKSLQQFSAIKEENRYTARPGYHLPIYTPWRAIKVENNEETVSAITLYCND